MKYEIRIKEFTPEQFFRTGQTATWDYPLPDGVEADSTEEAAQFFGEWVCERYCMNNDEAITCDVTVWYIGMFMIEYRDINNKLLFIDIVDAVPVIDDEEEARED